MAHRHGNDGQGISILRMPLPLLNSARQGRPQLHADPCCIVGWLIKSCGCCATPPGDSRSCIRRRIPSLGTRNPRTRSSDNVVLHTVCARSMGRPRRWYQPASSPCPAKRQHRAHDVAVAKLDPSSCTLPICHHKGHNVGTNKSLTLGFLTISSLTTYFTACWMTWVPVYRYPIMTAV
jgi:hypothetical protein